MERDLMAVASLKPEHILLAAAMRRRKASLPALPWREWASTHFAAYTNYPFADRHVRFWEWMESLTPGVRPKPRVEAWPRGGGKCLAGDTEVLRANGTRVAIRDIALGETILSYDEDSGRIQPDIIIDKIHSGVKPTITITTRSRKTVRLTPDHRVLTFDGWKRADEVAIGDRIASPRYTPIAPYVNRTDEEVRFLAYMLAEGGTSGTHGCRFTNADPEIVDDFTRCAEAMGFSVRPSGAYGYYISAAMSWVQDAGLRGCYATNKRMPKWVYGLPEQQKWMFLAAFIDTDGWIQQDRGRIGITLANQGLITDLQYLFMQVGVVATCYEKPNTHAGAWTLVVAQEYVERCAEMLPLRLKGERLQASLTTSRYSLLDTYPASVARGLPRGVNRKIRNAGVTRLGTPYDVTRGKIRRAMEIEPLEHWVKLESADVFWDKVTALEESGDADTYDVEVAKSHNLITDGLVSHNSSTIELGCAWLGSQSHPPRHYVLYVSKTQAQANKHVQAIAQMLERVGIKRAINEYGSSKGWRHEEIRTANGFNITAFGLDSGMRGVRLDEYRPDVIVMDDIDDRLDSEDTIRKKIDVLTTTILPAGSSDVAVIVVQNLIHEDSIVSRLCDTRADFLHDRLPPTVEPAVTDLQVEQRITEDGTPRYVITSGIATWEGQNLATCEQQINSWGLRAFEREAQHDVAGSENGLWDRGHDIEPWRYTLQRNGRLPQMDRVVVAIDPNTSSNGDEAGIIVAGSSRSWNGRTMDQAHAYVLADRTVAGGPDEWAAAVVAAWRDYQADDIVAEVNNGGEMVAITIGTVSDVPPVRVVHASRGKRTRAEPVQKLYSDGRVHHVGVFPELEKQMCRWTPGDDSPDRLDACFIAGTMVTTQRGDIPIEDVRVGDLARTRTGWYPVTNCGMTNPRADVIRVQFSDGRTLTGTPNHPIFTHNRGFVPLDTIVWSDIIETNQTQAKERQWPAKKTSSNSTASHLFGIPTARVKHHAATITHTKAVAGPKASACSIRKSGSQFMGRFRRGMTSIIGMAISSIITSTIWNASQRLSTHLATRQSFMRPALSTSTTFDTSPLNGIGAKRDERGTGSTGNDYGNVESRCNEHVLSAARRTGLWHIARLTNSVHVSVYRDTTNETEPTTRTEHVSFVETHSTSKSPERNDPARVFVERNSASGQSPVYNLEVAGQPEYFANGVLVHNCVWSITDLLLDGSDYSELDDYERLMLGGR